MPLTKTEQELIRITIPATNMSAASEQILHELFFSGGKTIDNIPYSWNVNGHVFTDWYSIRDWDEEKFQIVEGASSAHYPPKKHLPEIKSGIQQVLEKLGSGCTDYAIIKKVPEPRQDVFPTRYEFSHSYDWRQTWAGTIKQNRTAVREMYFSGSGIATYRTKPQWWIGNVFGGGYSLPEDTIFLKRFSAALKKL